MGTHVNELSNVVMAIKDGYEKGLNSPNNIKRVFIFGTLVGVQYHLPLGSTNKKLNFKQVEIDNSLDGLSYLRKILNCLTSPKVCSSIEEIVITDDLCENTNTVIDIITGFGSVQLMNRFPRLRCISVVDSSIENDSIFEIVFSQLGSCDGKFETFTGVLEDSSLVITKHETKNAKWYDRTYYRKYMYTFDEKIEKLFDKIHTAIEKRERELTLHEIEVNDTSDEISRYFKENEQTVLMLLSTIKTEYAGRQRDVLTIIKAAINKFEKGGASKAIASLHFNEIGQTFKIYLDIVQKIDGVEVTHVTNMAEAQSVVSNIAKIKDALQNVSRVSNETIVTYLTELDELLSKLIDMRLREDKVELFKQNIKEVSELSPDYWIDPIKVFELVAKARGNFKVIGVEKNDEVSDRFKTYLRIFNLDGFVQASNFLTNLDKHTECLTRLNQFLQDYSNWDINIALQQHFYYVLIKEGYRVLPVSETELFIRAFSKPLKKADLDYIYDVPVKYREKLKSDINEGKSLYVNENFENDTDGYDMYSLKILYKETDVSIEYFFLLPLSGSIYAGLVGDTSQTFSNDMYTSFSKLEMMCNLRFNSIHTIHTVSSAPKNSLRIMTLKEDVMQKNFLLTDCLNKTGVFASEYLRDVDFGNLERLFVGIAPNGAVYADTRSSGSWSFTYGGGNGSGKTVATWTAIVQLIKHGCPLITVDAKNEAAQMTKSLGYMGFGNAEAMLKVYGKDNKLVEQSVPEYFMGLRFQEAYFKYYKEIALRQFSERVRTGDTIKGVDDYLKNWKDSNVLDISYTAFFVDEIESMLNDKRYEKKLLNMLCTIGSMARTAGCWRLYATQSPKAGQLGQLTTNMNHFVMGAKLSPSIVTQSLKLKYDAELYQQIDSGFETTGVELLNKKKQSQGLFAFYPSKTADPVLVKSIYFKESENEREFKDFLMRYYPEGYERGLRILNETIEGMIRSGYLQQYGYEDLYEYLIKTRYNGIEPLSGAYGFDVPYKKGSSTQSIEESELYDDFDNFEDDSLYEDMLIGLDGDFSENQSTINKNNTLERGMGEVSDCGFNAELNKEVFSGNNLPYQSASGIMAEIGTSGADQYKKAEVIPVNVSIDNTLAGKNLGKAAKYLMNNDRYYRNVFKDITERILEQIRLNFGGLERVYAIEIAEGHLCVNGSMLQINATAENVGNPLIKRHLENGTLGELFDFGCLRKLKKLNHLVLSSFEYVHKLQVDLGINKWSELFKRLPSVGYVKVGEHVIKRKQTEVTSEYKEDKATQDRSDNYIEVAAKNNKQYIPTKAGVISNFYRNNKIPKSVKVLATGGTFAATAAIGATFGGFVLPLVLVGMAIKSALRGK